MATIEGGQVVRGLSNIGEETKLAVLAEETKIEMMGEELLEKAQAEILKKDGQDRAKAAAKTKAEMEKELNKRTQEAEDTLRRRETQREHIDKSVLHLRNHMKMILEQLDAQLEKDLAEAGDGALVQSTPEMQEATMFRSFLSHMQQDMDAKADRYAEARVKRTEIIGDYSRDGTAHPPSEFFTEFKASILSALAAVEKHQLKGHVKETPDAVTKS
mmetsp:Transcript_11354/g.19427  ORF Transcript_11354/g.19427 Transcript_11354/m.19427 type:complete len:216 (-) Transcript_11354:187-834(-)